MRCCFMFQNFAKTDHNQFSHCWLCISSFAYKCAHVIAYMENAYMFLNTSTNKNCVMFQLSAQGRNFLRSRASVQPAALWTEERSSISLDPTSPHSLGLFSWRRVLVRSVYINLVYTKYIYIWFCSWLTSYLPVCLNWHVLPTQMDDHCGKWKPELCQKNAVE